MLNSSLFASLPGLFLLISLAITAAYYGATLIAAFLLLVFLRCASACLWRKHAAHAAPEKQQLLSADLA